MTGIAPVTLAAAAAKAAVSTKGVVRLHRGPGGTVATYGAGRRVPGVRVGDGPQIHVHLVVTLDRPIPMVAADVRDAVLAALERLGDFGRVVHVHVADVHPEAGAGSGDEQLPVTEEL
jgi:uncharacterized alkaline shock family protein YloU